MKRGYSHRTLSEDLKILQIPMKPDHLERKASRLKWSGTQADGMIKSINFLLSAEKGLNGLYFILKIN